MDVEELLRSDGPHRHRTSCRSGCYVGADARACSTSRVFVVELLTIGGKNRPGRQVRRTSGPRSSISGQKTFPHCRWMHSTAIVAASKLHAGLDRAKLLASRCLGRGSQRQVSRSRPGGLGSQLPAGGKGPVAHSGRRPGEPMPDRCGGRPRGPLPGGTVTWLRPRQGASASGFHDVVESFRASARSPPSHTGEAFASSRSCHQRAWPGG